MPTKQYKTIPDELVEYVDGIKGHFRNLGFTVRVERHEVGFPYTPILVCRRGRITTLIVEIDAQIRFERLEKWLRYGRSCGSETQIALCLPSSVDVSAIELARFQQEGIGLYSVDRNGLREQRPPVDLGLNLQLPELDDMPARARQLLGPAYEKFDRREWREGFERACKSLEAEARRYLKRWSRTGRIVIQRKKGPISLSNKEINKMTMGALAQAFSNIQAQNHADSVVAQALARINRDRVGVAHFVAERRTEARLRANVGQHMWVITDALRAML